LFFLFFFFYHFSVSRCPCCTDSLPPPPQMSVAPRKGRDSPPFLPLMRTFPFFPLSPLPKTLERFRWTTKKLIFLPAAPLFFLLGATPFFPVKTDAAHPRFLKKYQPPCLEFRKTPPFFSLMAKRLSGFVVPERAMQYF